MAWTQNDVDVLDNAIKKGIRTVSYPTGSVTYHSLAEMLQLREAMKAEVSGGTVRRTVGRYDSGLGPSRCR